MARMRTFYYTDGRKVRVSVADWRRKVRAQVAAAARVGKVVWQNAKGRTFVLAPDKAAKRAAMSLRAKQRAMERERPISDEMEGEGPPPFDMGPPPEVPGVVNMEVVMTEDVYVDTTDMQLIVDVGGHRESVPLSMDGLAALEDMGIAVPPHVRTDVDRLTRDL